MLLEKLRGVEISLFLSFFVQINSTNSVCEIILINSTATYYEVSCAHHKETNLPNKRKAWKIIIIVGGMKMKKAKEYKMSIAAFWISLVLYGISMVTGLIPGLTSSIDKICFYLGNAFLCFALVFLAKSKDNSGKDE